MTTIQQTAPVPATLSRRIGPGLLTLYGLGIMVGAGIYVLVGAVAGQAGVWAPLAFLMAGLVALPSALSYAELSARLPEAGGEVAYIEAGFKTRRAGLVMGLAVLAAGLVSSAAVLRGGAGYAVAFLPVTPEVAIIVGGAILTFIALWGVLESLSFAAILTLVEVLGLALVIWAGWTAPPVEGWTMPAAPHWSAIFGAVALCFFAFVGFEDMVNMAEEARDPHRTMPRAVLGALALTAVLYALVSVAAVRSVPAEVLAGSLRPLAEVWQAATGHPAVFLSAIAVAAAANGVLANIVMAARVLLGMGRRVGWLAPLARVHSARHTPVLATIIAGLAVTIAALAAPVEALATLAAFVVLWVFIAVNLSLIRLKATTPAAPFRVPVWVPWLGLSLSAGALVLAVVG